MDRIAERQYIQLLLTLIFTPGKPDAWKLARPVWDRGRVDRRLSLTTTRLYGHLEKALAGVASSGQTDSGVSARLFGHLLGWLNDHTSDVFFIGTCNDISKLPPEFARAERFDAVFFIDLPSAPERELIWNMYLELFGLDPAQTRPRDEAWTGAEVRACCRLAALLDVPLVQAAQNIVPISVTAGESVERLRNWAQGRCIAADVTGIYQRASSGSKRRRRVTPPDPSVN